MIPSHIHTFLIIHFISFGVDNVGEICSLIFLLLLVFLLGRMSAQWHSSYFGTVWRGAAEHDHYFISSSSCWWRTCCGQHRAAVDVVVNIPITWWCGVSDCVAAVAFAIFYFRIVCVFFALAYCPSPIVHPVESVLYFTSHQWTKTDFLRWIVRGEHFKQRKKEFDHHKCYLHLLIIRHLANSQIPPNHLQVSEDFVLSWEFSIGFLPVLREWAEIYRKVIFPNGDTYTYKQRTCLFIVRLEHFPRSCYSFSCIPSILLEEK